jgi:hypothetical protein
MLSRNKGLDDIAHPPVFPLGLICRDTQESIYSAPLQNPARKAGQNPIFNFNSNHIQKYTGIWIKRIWGGVFLTLSGTPGEVGKVVMYRDWFGLGIAVEIGIGFLRSDCESRRRFRSRQIPNWSHFRSSRSGHSSIVYTNLNSYHSRRQAWAGLTRKLYTWKWDVRLETCDTLG